MMIERLKAYLKKNPKLQEFALWLLTPKGQAKPRWWFRTFVTPWLQTFEKGSIVRSSARMDIFPWHSFKLGKKSIIESYAVINNGVGDVEIGDETLIGIGCVLIGPITVGNHVMLAQHILVSGLNHEYENVEIPISKQPLTKKEIVIEDNVWIGANAILTSGVRVGKHSVVAAGSVVTKNVPPYSVVAGNPARLLRSYNAETKVWEVVAKPENNS